MMHEKERAIMQAWNAAHPIGTPVTVMDNNGEPFDTVTRSEAWMLSTGKVAIKVKGVAGGYALEKVTVREEKK
jgi:hypothetical protein